MGVFSIILIVIWLTVLYNGIYCLVKGYFPKEKDREEKHEPNMYRKWVRVCGALLTICGGLNVTWEIIGAVDANFDDVSLIYTLVTVGVSLVLIAVTYWFMVKKTDQKCGIKSEFDDIIKKDK